MQKPLKVYLAAPYQAKEEIKQYAQELRDEGVIVTSSWLDEPHKPTLGVHELPHEQNQHYAITDVKDVRDADIFVLFTDKTKQIIRAGRHVEFGIAIGIGFTRKMPIFVVGEEYENIFHHMPQVFHFKSWDHLKNTLVAKDAALVS